MNKAEWGYLKIWSTMNYVDDQQPGLDFSIPQKQYLW
jgi:hypothetical protein